MHVDVMVANESHAVYADEICEEVFISARELIHDGICLFVQSDRMEMDKIEIFRVGDDSGLKEEK